MRSVSHDLDSMTSQTQIDVFLDVFVYVESTILFFQKLQRAFVFEMFRKRIVMIVFEKLSFKKI